MHGVGVVLSHSSALPRPFYWLGLPSVHDLPAATLHTHSHASVCAYTSLPNASPPRARTPRSQSIHSLLQPRWPPRPQPPLSRSFPSFPSMEGPSTLRPAPQSVPQDCLGKAQLLRRPHGTSHGSTPSTTRVLVPPRSPRSHIVFLVDGASDTGEQVLEA